MKKFEKEFRQEYPETTGETDTAFDNCNYIEWLENKLVVLIDTKPVDTCTCKTNNACIIEEDGFGEWRDYCLKCECFRNDQ